MIRFMTGLFLTLGSIGGLEHDTMGFPQFVLFVSIGLILIIWALPKLIIQSSKYYQEQRGNLWKFYH